MFVAQFTRKHYTVPPGGRFNCIIMFVLCFSTDIYNEKKNSATTRNVFVAQKSTLPEIKWLLHNDNKG